jgi:hypothetical protein
MRFWRDQAIVGAICAVAGLWLLTLGSWPCAVSPDLSGACSFSWPGWVFAFSWGIFGCRLFLWFFMSQKKEEDLCQRFEAIEQVTGIRWVSVLLKWWFVVGIRDDKSNA